MSEEIQLLPIRTGSSGNCSIITDGETTLLLDAGIPFKWIYKGLELLHLRSNQIDGILISHGHIDHIHGLPVLLNNLNIPIYTGQGTVDTFLEGPTSDRRWRKIAQKSIILEPHDNERIHTLEINVFNTYHDSPDSFGFRISNDKVALAFISDTGRATEDMISFSSNADLLFVESNHDKELLKTSGRPPFLKRRIRATHLSNDQMISLVKNLQGRKTKGVVLNHLSQDCNTHRHVKREVREACKKYSKLGRLRWFISPRYDFSEHLAVSSSHLKKKTNHGFEIKLPQTRL
ncbi:MAG: MBL fold metallo-hydrolase [Candidatus Hodarchaeota archaeon]